MDVCFSFLVMIGFVIFGIVKLIENSKGTNRSGSYGYSRTSYSSYDDQDDYDYSYDDDYDNDDDDEGSDHWGPV